MGTLTPPPPPCYTGAKERKGLFMKKKSRIVRDAALYAVFALYLLLLLLILFRQHHETRSLNLVPLRSVLQYITGADPLGGETSAVQAQFLQGLALSNLLGNLVLFFPLGVYVKLFWERLPLWGSILLPAGASLMAGDLVVTSGLGGYYPSGLVIGSVEELVVDEGGLTQSAVLVPSADLEELVQVFVIKSFEIVE